METLQHQCTTVAMAGDWEFSRKASLNLFECLNAVQVPVMSAINLSTDCSWQNTKHKGQLSLCDYQPCWINFFCPSRPTLHPMLGPRVHELSCPLASARGHKSKGSEEEKKIRSRFLTPDTSLRSHMTDWCPYSYDDLSCLQVLLTSPSSPLWA